MTYKIVDNQLVPETDKNYISLSSSKRKLFDALKGQVDRAEAAEAHAARLMQERDEARRQLAEAQMAIDVLSNTVVAQNNEIKRLSQQREDVAEYRAEIARLNQVATA